MTDQQSRPSFLMEDGKPIPECVLTCEGQKVTLVIDTTGTEHNIGHIHYGLRQAMRNGDLAKVINHNTWNREPLLPAETEPEAEVPVKPTVPGMVMLKDKQPAIGQKVDVIMHLEGPAGTMVQAVATDVSPYGTRGGHMTWWIVAGAPPIQIGHVETSKKVLGQPLDQWRPRA